VPQASREPAGRRQWAEHRLEAVRKGQVGQPGVTDFGPGVERFSGPCARPHSAGNWISRSRGVTTTPWRIARWVCQGSAKEAYDEEPLARGGRLSKTQRTLPDQSGPGLKDER